MKFLEGAKEHVGVNVGVKIHVEGVKYPRCEFPGDFFLAIRISILFQ